MLFYVMLWYGTVCYVTLRYVMLCYVMLCYFMLCYGMLCYVMVCHVTLRYIMLCYVMLCYVMLCYGLWYKNNFDWPRDNLSNGIHLTSFCLGTESWGSQSFHSFLIFFSFFFSALPGSFVFLFSFLLVFSCPSFLLSCAPLLVLVKSFLLKGEKGQPEWIGFREIAKSRATLVNYKKGLNRLQNHLTLQGEQFQRTGP